MNISLMCFSCFNKQKYHYIANPDDLLINDIHNIYVNDDKYRIIEKKAYIIKKCNKYYNVWNYRIVKNLTSIHYLLVTSSKDKGKWYLVPYHYDFMNKLPKNIDSNRKREVYKIDYSVTLDKHRNGLVDVSLND